MPTPEAWPRRRVVVPLLSHSSAGRRHSRRPGTVRTAQLLLPRLVSVKPRPLSP